MNYFPWSLGVDYLKNKIWSGLAFILIFGFLSSCATTKKEPCVISDWSPIGEQDARNGLPDTAINRDAQNCHMVEILSNVEQYLDGYKKGLVFYCTPENAYQQGVSGSAYNHICPPDKEVKFLPAYNMGHELFEIHSELYDLRKKIKNTQDEIESLKNGIKNAESQIDSLETDKRSAKSNLFWLSSSKADYESQKKQYEDKISDCENKIRDNNALINENKSKISSLDFSLWKYNNDLERADRKAVIFEQNYSDKLSKLQ